MINPTETNIEGLYAELETIRRKHRESKKKRLYPSKLDPYHQTLVSRANKGASLAELKTWLAARGVQAGRTTIWLNLQRANLSRLDPYQQALGSFSDRGASLAELKAWLETKGIHVSQAVIWIAVRRWEEDQKGPHFLSPGWKQAAASAGSGEPASNSATTPSSDRKK